MLTISYLWVNVKNTKTQDLNFRVQLGIYLLDIEKTKLGPYIIDSNVFKGLKITFNPDHTFTMNFRVPFLFDSIGRWNSAGVGLEDWNWLYYESWGYSSYKENVGDQFTSPWTADSIFYINGATPQRGREGIQRIFFKKIR